MSGTMMTAASRLADVLTQENAALTALDLAGAAGMLDAKRDATAALAAAQDQPVDMADTAARRQLAQRLGELAQQNRSLLERAIAVQGRVIGVIARAIPRAGSAPRYGVHGGFAQSGRPAAYAFAARA